MGPEHDILDISSDEEDAAADGSGKNSLDYQSSLEQIAKMLELEDGPWASEEVVIVDELFCTSAVHKSNSTQSSMATADDSNDDCMVLDGDPDKPSEVVQDEGNKSDELLIVGEKGQIACRDYPHSRHLCATFPFSTTSHEKFCKLCHCYVCDILAPCIYWGTGSSSADHCHSSDKEENWRLLRKTLKKVNNSAENTGRLPGAALSIRPPGTRPQAMRTPAIRTSRNNLLQRISSSSMHGGPRSVPCRTSVFMHAGSRSVPAETSVSAHVGPASVPRQNSDSRSNMYHSANSFGTPNIISQRQSHQSGILYSNTQHLNRSQTFSGTNITQRQWCGPSSQVTPVHSKGRAVGTGLTNITAKRLRTPATNQNQVFPRKLQRSPSIPASLMDENIKKWQDILLGRDPDLGTDFRQCTVYPQPVMYGQSCIQTSANTGTNLLSSSALVTNNLRWTDAASANASAHVSVANSPLLNVQSINPYAVPENHPVSGEVPLGEVIGSLGQEAPQDTGDQGYQELNPHTYGEQELWTSLQNHGIDRFPL